MNYLYSIQIRDRQILFCWNRYRYFQKIFTYIWPIANIWLATDTDIPKFDYRYIFRYFNNYKVFWLKLVWIAYSS